MIACFLLLLVAHCYGDFLLQPSWMVRRKGFFPVLLLHAGIHGGLAYALLQAGSLWQVSVAVAVWHAVVDFAKTRWPSGPTAFAVDQAAHVAGLAGIAWGAVALGGWSESGIPTTLQNWLVCGAGFCATVLGVGHFIGQVADRLCQENAGLREALGEGLRNGGAMIGRLERALIFLFLMIGEPAGIGFLIAAKSILRFEEAKKQPLAEYVLIGTLWSFGLAIALAWATKRLAFS